MLIHKREGTHGFTIVELLIVIVIIAILAAITIVTYTGIQNRARASAASSALSQAAKKLELYKVDNSAYPTSTNLASAGITNSNDTTYQYTSDGTTYCLTATNVTVSYYLNSTTTPSPTAGGCPGHGVGGNSAITNLATNPSVEVNGTGWSNRWYGVGGSGTLSLSTLAAHDGVLGYRKVWTVAGSSQDIGMNYNLSGIQPGKTYTFSSWIRDSVSAGHKAMIEWYDASSNKIGATIFSGEVALSANIWQRLSMTQTAPTGAISVAYIWGPYPSSGSPNSAVGRTVDFDSVMITEGSTLYNYADGSSPNWVWNGTANASSSTGPAL